MYMCIFFLFGVFFLFVGVTCTITFIFEVQIANQSQWGHKFPFQYLLFVTVILNMIKYIMLELT